MGRGLSRTGIETASQLVSGTFTVPGQSCPSVFFGAFNVAVWGSFTGLVQIERSFDGGVTWIPCGIDGTGTLAAYNGPVSLVVSEPEHQVAYRLNCTALTAGSVGYRMSQDSGTLFTDGAAQ